MRFRFAQRRSRDIAGLVLERRAARQWKVDVKLDYSAIMSVRKEFLPGSAMSMSCGMRLRYLFQALRLSTKSRHNGVFAVG